MTHSGFAVWFTGLSGAGKSTLATGLFERLKASGAKAELLDGDAVRTALSPGLGYSRDDRDANIRRIGFVSEVLSRHGVIAIVAAISPYRETRDEVKGKIANFVEVFVDCPIDVLTARDVKGLYKRALAGEVAHFTGISDAYEAPIHADVTIHSDTETVDASLEAIWNELLRRDLLRP